MPFQTAEDAPLEIGFLGAGNMGEALIAGLVHSGKSPSAIGFTDPNPERGRYLTERYPGIRPLERDVLARGARILVLAVKPQTMPETIPALREAVSAGDPLIISVAAGVTTGRLEEWLGPDTRIIRAMPNTPALIGMGITGLFANTRATEDDRQAADQLLHTVGETVWLSGEQDMHAVTGLSGSGPAYVFLLIEAMTAAGTRLGLDPDTALKLTLHTVAGAAALAGRMESTPGELRARVTSPGGTTEQALRVFSAHDFSEIVSRAIASAAARSRELGS